MLVSAIVEPSTISAPLMLSRMAVFCGPCTITWLGTLLHSGWPMPVLKTNACMGRRASGLNTSSRLVSKPLSASTGSQPPSPPPGSAASM